MKKADIKFTVGLICLTVGLLFLSFGIQWLFFVGLAMVMISSWFSLRQDNGAQSRFEKLFSTLVSIGAIIFLIWLSSFGTEKPPLAALLGVWIGICIEEIRLWQKSRNPLHGEIG